MSCFSFIEGQPLEVTPDMQAAFDKDGYIIVRGLLTSGDLSRLLPVLEREDGVRRYSYEVDDGQGRSSRMCLWNHPGNDITGMIGRCDKVAGTMESLLGGEVYHYHTKLMMKEPHTGGAFVWHQDYGYWYNNGCLFPDMGTVFIAVDKCDQENGCLKVLKGSHLIGRIDHKRVGGQTAADVDRVEQIMKVLPLEHVELSPGDALFFHSNIIHRSEQNNSPRRRWAFLIAYNRASNNPVTPHHHPLYTKLEKVPDSAIMECPLDIELKDKSFLEPDKDKTSWGRRVVNT